MKIIYKIASFDQEGQLKLLLNEYPSYQSAESAIINLPDGLYQVQKLFKNE